MKYYTSAQARHVLGDISANKLKHYVDAGILKRYFPPARKQGLYSRVEVDALANDLRQFYSDEKGEETHDRVRTALNHSGGSISLAG